MAFSFSPGQIYRRRDVFERIGVDPGTKGGPWDTGYRKFKGEHFIFCNIGIPGRTGHDYGNRLEKDFLIWFGKEGSRLSHPSIQDLIQPSSRVHIFVRRDQRAGFEYFGLGNANSHDDTTPVKIIWRFTRPEEGSHLPEEVTKPEAYYEGATKTVSVNAYERNPLARKKCIEYYGTKCVVCDFEFAMRYGDLGQGLIHVHHLVPLSETRGEYLLDPIKDLRPVCPNCHAMIHRKSPAYSIAEIQDLLRKKSDIG